ncbi:MAG: hypothetical protein QNI92_00905 [Desulfobacterales bacterium]|nr:hypothetical protein [Desulfobacterales bacterium]MDJ0913186.1 hypothetical protein [Desulfobacterales bacterium]
MKQLQVQLKTISKTLVSLSKQVERINAQVAKLSKAKPAPKKKAKAKVAKKAPAAKKTTAAKRMTVLDSVLKAIGKSKRGVNIETLRTKTGLGPRQLSNALYKLSKKGTVGSVGRGLYVRK